MKTTLRIMALVLLCATAVFTFSSCAQPTVEEYARSIEEDVEKAGTNNIFKLELTSEGNSLVYTYTYSKDAPADDLEENVNNAKVFIAANESAIKQSLNKMVETDCEAIESVKYVYCDAEGNPIGEPVEVKAGE